MCKPKQVAGFFKRGVLGQIVNVDAAIGKNTLVAIDVANAGICGNNAFQAFRGRSAGHAGHILSLSQMVMIVAGTTPGRGAGNFLLYAKGASDSRRCRVTSVHGGRQTQARCSVFSGMRMRFATSSGRSV